ncbi:MAG TPA: ORF6N domain-containing protein [Pyrinomonadaceae bacterium]|nr:ORF6N domain-containing protein [Pyrinomonadaceae bacterium]
MNRTLVKTPLARVADVILVIRDENVILDTDLALLYGVETRALIQAVKRNDRRFPLDFMFQLTRKEFDALRSQFVISKGRGGRRHLPYAFTEHGAIMAANVLNNERAVEASVQVVRAFVKLRQMLTSNTELSRKLDSLEQKYDRQFKIVFDAIRQLMTAPRTEAKPIGFRAGARKK